MLYLRQQIVGHADNDKSQLSVAQVRLAYTYFTKHANLPDYSFAFQKLSWTNE